jgi:carbonic anhydrase/acetyltransferase-like protein (isoleucine patch superfamily)
MHRLANDVFLAPTATVTGDVVLGAGSNLWFGVVVRGDLARITLGERANLQDGVIVHTDTGVPLDIEPGLVAGHGAILHGRRIGADTLVGMGAILLGGSEVGPECLIAAGCVVAEGVTIPPRSLVMGVPGRVVRAVSPEQVANTRRINAHYVEMARRYADGQFKVLSAEC